jgi:hypothetical protein
LLIILLTNRAHATHPVSRNIFRKFRKLSFILVYCISLSPSRNNHSSTDFCCFYTTCSRLLCIIFCFAVSQQKIIETFSKSFVFSLLLKHTHAIIRSTGFRRYAYANNGRHRQGCRRF